MVAPADPRGARRPGRPRLAGLVERASSCSAPTPPSGCTACGPAFARIVFENGIERDKKIAQHMVDKPVGRHDGADRARRRLRRRRRPHQGLPERGRLLEHRGRQALHHLGRARHGREHHAPRAGPPRGRRGRRRTRHQGPEPVPRAEVPLRPRDRRADRRAQRRLRHQRREEDGHQGLHDLRGHLRRRRPGPGLAARRGPRRHQPDVPRHRERPHDGRRQGHRDAVDRLPQRARLRQGARPGRRPDAGVRQDRPARHDHPPPRRPPLAADAEVVRRGPALADDLRRDVAGRRHHQGGRRRGRRAGRRRSTTCCCRSSRATARSVRGPCWAPSRCRRSAVRASCRTTRSSSTSATPRSTRCTRAPRRSRARTCSSARSSRTRARRWATCRPRSRRSSRARPATVASRSSASCSPRASRTPRRSSARCSPT